MYRHTGTKMEELLTLQAALKDEVAEAQGKVVTEEALRPPHLGTKKTACETCHFAKGTASEEERDAVRNHKRVYHKCGGACPGDHVNHKCQMPDQHFDETDLRCVTAELAKLGAQLKAINNELKDWRKKNDVLADFINKSTSTTAGKKKTLSNQLQSAQNVQALRQITANAQHAMASDGALAEAARHSTFQLAPAMPHITPPMRNTPTLVTRNAPFDLARPFAANLASASASTSPTPSAMQAEINRLTALLAAQAPALLSVGDDEFDRVLSSGTVSVLAKRRSSAADADDDHDDKGNNDRCKARKVVDADVDLDDADRRAIAEAEATAKRVREAAIARRQAAAAPARAATSIADMRAALAAMSAEERAALLAPPGEIGEKRASEDIGDAGK